MPIENEPTGDTAPQGPNPEGEGTEPKELTLEEQAGIYAEMFDVDSEMVLEAARKLQAEMSEEERRELTMLVYAPEGMTTDDAWQMVKKENPVFEYKDTDPTKIKTTSETGKAIVVFARYSQESDEDTLGKGAKSAKDWEETGDKFMSSKLRMIVGEFYRRAKGKQLDQINATLSPGSHTSNGRVPFLIYHPNDGEVCLGSYHPESSLPGLGVRRVRQMEV